MSGQPMNLRPYGNAYAPPVGVGGSPEEAALRRAADKLQMIRGGRTGDVPAGPNKRSLTVALILCTPLILLCLLALTATFQDGRVSSVAAVPLFFMAVLAAIPLIIFLQSRPRTPKATLAEFYRAAGRGNSSRALALLSNADRDSIPRRQPLIEKLGQPSGQPWSFINPLQFQRYWNELVRSHPSPYCLARVSRVKVTMAAPDVAIVDFKLRLIMNTQLWLLLILVALLIAVIVDLATRKVVRADLRKVLVKVGDEWKLFNGEWQGYEEYDLRWLSQPTGPARTARL